MGIMVDTQHRQSWQVTARKLTGIVRIDVLMEIYKDRSYPKQRSLCES